VKLSAVYRLSEHYPGYANARPLHDALLRANPERLMWGTDWPHPSIPVDVRTTIICSIYSTTGCRTR
jgi:2-pyrone-4,6-dicarboxylate lactonase